MPAAQNQDDPVVDDQIVATITQPVVVTQDNGVLQQRQPQTRRVEQTVVRPDSVPSWILNFFALKNWRFESTFNRARLCIWAFILITHVCCLVTRVLLWVSWVMFFRSLIVWRGGRRIADGFVRRRELRLDNQEIPAQDRFWNDLFHEQDIAQSYHAHFRLTEHALGPVGIIYELSIPLIDHPVVWLAIVLTLFLTHNVLCFVHDSLYQAKNSMRVTFFH